MSVLCRGEGCGCARLGKLGLPGAWSVFPGTDPRCCCGCNGDAWNCVAVLWVLWTDCGSDLAWCAGVGQRRGRLWQCWIEACCGSDW